MDEAFKAFLSFLLLYIKGCAYVHADVSFYGHVFGAFFY